MSNSEEENEQPNEQPEKQDNYNNASPSNIQPQNTFLKIFNQIFKPKKYLMKI